MDLELGAGALPAMELITPMWPALISMADTCKLR